MSAIDAAAPVEAINNNSSAGERLRCAREHLNLSIRDVASALNLMVSHVRGIETDRYAALTNDKQFLHRLHDYASLVDLDANEIVDIYRSQSAAAAAQIEARPAKRSKRYDSKWYGVGALAVTCVCLGIWSLQQVAPVESTSDTVTSSGETAGKKPSTVPPGKDYIAKSTVIEASKLASSLPISDAKAVSVPPASVRREETMSLDEAKTPTAVETVARSDQAALETSPEQANKNAINIAPTNTILGKNALRTIGAKPLKKTLIELKSDGITQAMR
ncbi:MAG: helix-turn-helix domain-containing protein [Pseudomonadales bacterium]